MPKIESNTSKAVGTKIKILRKSKKLTQSALASMVGVTFRQLQKYEKVMSKKSTEN